MSIKSNERERRAVADHDCPRCHWEAGKPCRGFGKGHPVLQHPHTERTALIEEWPLAKKNHHKPCICEKIGHTGFLHHETCPAKPPDRPSMTDLPAGVITKEVLDFAFWEIEDKWF